MSQENNRKGEVGAQQNPLEVEVLVLYSNYKFQ
jgi:hypothetical protein